VVYCVIPRDLAAELHAPLRRHFASRGDVEVVVERRCRDRRVAERRVDPEPTAEDNRRRIRNLGGRRVAERRAALAPVPAPELPRRARPHAERLLFVERVVRTSEQEEDVDTARLVTRIQAGDRELVGELYLRYFDRIFGYVQMVLRDRHEAEDITQQVFVRVLEALPAYERREQRFRAWLFAIVRNQLVDELRKRNRLDLVEPRALEEQRDRTVNGEPDLSALGWISDRELMLFVERLPVQHRQVLVLRYMLDLPAKDIARILDRSPADVRKIQERALRFLSKRLSALGRTPREDERAHWRRRPSFMGVLRSRRFALRH
jgi:RNA polymerase sigma-70 factor (ECF subfamily)